MFQVQIHNVSTSGYKNICCVLIIIVMYEYTYFYFILDIRQSSFKFPMSVKWFFDLEIITFVPNEEEFPRKCEQEDRAVKKAWEGRNPTEWGCDLAWSI